MLKGDIMTFRDLVESKLKIGSELAKLLKDEKVSTGTFLKLAKAEKLKQEEIDDLGYMEDKIDVWRDNELI